MAAALERMLADDVLAKELTTNGLDVVERDFDWENRTDELEAVLDGVVAEPGPGSVPAPPPPPSDPALSVVVLAWDNLRYTQLFAESVRRYTAVPYELIIVDNGSKWPAASYAESAADQAVLNPENLGFARGMNQGLAVAQGRYVAFCNNDTRMPEGWAERLLETAEQYPNAGIIVPAVTEARNKATVRHEAGDTVETLPPFSAPPAAVVYLMRADLVRSLDGWGEEYEIASGEDVDLCFKVWVNDLDIVCDSRVLVDHVGKATAWRLKNWRRLWARNRERFLAKWKGDGEVPRLDSCDVERFERNRATARAVAQWMERYFKTRDRPARASLVRVAREGMLWVRFGAAARRGWPIVRRRLPPHVAHRLRMAVRRFR
jgi:GT2 family glycosyltransferase